MKNKSLIIILLVLVLLLGGAGLLYSKLSGKGSNLVTLGPTGTTASAETTLASAETTLPAQSEASEPDTTSASEPAETTAPESSSSEGTETTAPQDPDKMEAPDFQVYDKNNQPVKLSQFRGKPVILNFWSSNCGPCRIEMPDFQNAFQTYGQDIHFVMVNVTDGSWDTVESASSFIEKEGFTFPVYFDTSEDAANTYMVRSLPTTYFIDEEGYLVAQATGMIHRDLLQQGIDMLLP